MSALSWQVALVSATISAVVGTLVSLLAVSQTTVRRAKAERRDEARQQISGIVQEHRLAVKQYRYGINTSLKRAPNSPELSDYQFARCVLHGAAALVWWRRFLIRRRLTNLVGSLYVEFAELNPVEGGDMAGLANLIRLRQTTNQDLGSPTEALYHRAFSESPESPELLELERQLARLGDAW